jgi:hypothetical protein
MPGLTFSKLANSHFDAAYSLICARTEWLHSKNIKMWTDPIPWETYKTKQQNGENFGLFCDGELKAVLSLVKGHYKEWKPELGTGQLLWLSTLASDVKSAGKGYGKLAVQKALEYIKDHLGEDLYLDCVKGNGFLPGFYKRLEFKKVTGKVINWPKCGITDMVLMKYSITRR